MGIEGDLSRGPLVKEAGRLAENSCEPRPLETLPLPESRQSPSDGNDADFFHLQIYEGCQPQKKE